MAVFVSPYFFMTEKENWKELGSSWASCLVVDVIWYSAKFGLEMCMLVEGSSSIYSRGYITPRLSWPVPPLLPSWMAGQPVAAPRCCRYCPAISFLRWVAWRSFPCSDGGKAISLLPWRPLLQLHLVAVPPESLPLGKQMPRWGRAEQRCSCCVLGLDYRVLCLRSHFSWC